MSGARATTAPSTASTGVRLLTALDLHKSYLRGPEEVRALRGASLDLDRAEVVALVGPSGSGKTTLLNVLFGWEEPDEGTIRWSNGAPPRRPGDRTWREIAVLPQALGLMEELSIRENVELPLRLAGRRDEAARGRAAALLRAFGIDGYADRSPSEISLGEQQRTALARAIVLSPRLLLADEPTGHQDAGWARVVFRALQLASREGTCCLVATHSNEFLRYVHRILAIRDGRVRPVNLTPASDG
jgi:putative ABC transport system ATP-binding protein